LEGEGRIINSKSNQFEWPNYKSTITPIDNDLDGIPDFWEKTFNLNPEDPGDFNFDPDRDGYLNIEEFLNDTDPLDINNLEPNYLLRFSNSTVDYSLLQNFPNPFDTLTKIQFLIKEPSHIEITVLNIKGEVVARLVEGFIYEGEYEFLWDATLLEPGTYFVTMKFPNSQKIIKAVKR
jgi:hypothetical protein